MAIKMPSSIEAIVFMLGIFYAGGAFLPIDPSLPDNRIDFILKDSGAVICLERWNILIS